MPKVFEPKSEIAGRRLRKARQLLGYKSAKALLDDVDFWRRKDGSLIIGEPSRVRVWEREGVPFSELEAVANAFGVNSYIFIATEDGFDDNAFAEIITKVKAEKDGGIVIGGLSPYEKVLKEEPDDLLAAVTAAGYDKQFLRDYVADLARNSHYRMLSVQLMCKMGLDSDDVELLSECDKVSRKELSSHLVELFDAGEKDKLRDLLTEEFVVSLMKTKYRKILPIVDWMVNDEGLWDVNIYQNAEEYERRDAKFAVIDSVIRSDCPNRLELIALQKRDDSWQIRDKIGFYIVELIDSGELRDNEIDAAIDLLDWALHKAAWATMKEDKWIPMENALKKLHATKETAQP